MHLLTRILPEGGWCADGVLHRRIGHAHRDRVRREGDHGGVGAGEKHVLAQSGRCAACKAQRRERAKRVDRVSHIASVCRSGGGGGGDAVGAGQSMVHTRCKREIIGP